MSSFVPFRRASETNLPVISAGMVRKVSPAGCFWPSWFFSASLGRPFGNKTTVARWVIPEGQPQTLMFLAFALAFAIKVPLFPFHTWLPDAHVEAPTAGSVILAGVLLKLGTYGFVRFCLPLFPDASLAFGPLVFALALIGIVYGAIVCAMQ